MKFLRVVLLLSVPGAAALILGGDIHGQQRDLGILGREAPTWEISQWANLPPGVKALDVDDFEGKILYLFCFQSWCPGCHSHGFPTLQTVSKRFAGEEDVSFVTVQTTFEGFHTNNFDKAKETVADFGLDLPVGQSGTQNERSELMRRYRTGGTPWTVIIDRNGVVRYNGFNISPDQATAIIKALLAEDVE